MVFLAIRAASSSLRALACRAPLSAAEWIPKQDSCSARILLCSISKPTFTKCWHLYKTSALYSSVTVSNNSLTVERRKHGQRRGVATNLQASGGSRKQDSELEDEKKHGGGGGSIQVAAKGKDIEFQNVNRSKYQAVFVVDSPGKAKTLEKYLGLNCLVLPTHGHVRDLAGRPGSVRVESDFALLWEVPCDARPHLNRIKAALEKAKYLVLALDPDREGEAIAWHVLELLISDGVLKRKGIRFARISFTEVTESAVLRAMEAPREIDMELVNAYIARRALDYLVGFNLSPLLWRKLPGIRSAGRLQSAALSLVCDREREIENFTSPQYWTVEADARISVEDSPPASVGKGLNNNLSIPVQLTHVRGKKIELYSIISEDKAKTLAEGIASSKFRVSSVVKGTTRRDPPLPYTTSTLLGDAQNKLGFRLAHTMNLAQQLYEGVDLGDGVLTGLITYAETSSCELAEEAVENIRSYAFSRYGEENLPMKQSRDSSKMKNLRESEEAIRPTDVQILPSILENVLGEDALRLYTLIWTQTILSQLKQPVFDEVYLDFNSERNTYQLRAFASSLSSTSFIQAPDEKMIGLQQDANLKNLSNDANLHDNIKISHLQKLKIGDTVCLSGAEARRNHVLPPKRFSEASLVLKLQELGIGRPQAYSATVTNLQNRKLLRLENGQLVPEVAGKMLAAFLSQFFPSLTDYDLAAHLEAQLDEVSSGKLEWKEVLRGFWDRFNENVIAARKAPMSEVQNALQERFADQIFKGLGENGSLCPSCCQGNLKLKLRQRGLGFLFGCDNSPACRYTTNILPEEESEDMAEKPEKPSAESEAASKTFIRAIGMHPTSGQIVLKYGPFGHYLQLDGIAADARRICRKIPKIMSPDKLTLEMAIELLSYPKILGQHPVDGEPVVVGVGKASFYVKHGCMTAHLPPNMEASGMTVEKALKLLKGTGSRRRGRKPRNASDRIPTELPKMPVARMPVKGKESGKGKESELVGGKEGGNDQTISTDRVESARDSRKRKSRKWKGKPTSHLPAGDMVAGVVIGGTPERERGSEIAEVELLKRSRKAGNAEGEAKGNRETLAPQKANEGGKLSTRSSMQKLDVSEDKQPHRGNAERDWKGISGKESKLVGGKDGGKERDSQTVSINRLESARDSRKRKSRKWKGKPTIHLPAGDLAAVGVKPERQHCSELGEVELLKRSKETGNAEGKARGNRETVALHQAKEGGKPPNRSCMQKPNVLEDKHASRGNTEKGKPKNGKERDKTSEHISKKWETKHPKNEKQNSGKTGSQQPKKSVVACTSSSPLKPSTNCVSERLEIENEKLEAVC